MPTPMIPKPREEGEEVEASAMCERVIARQFDREALAPRAETVAFQNLENEFRSQKAR
jgi:hypothetical protein